MPTLAATPTNLTAVKTIPYRDLRAGLLVRRYLTGTPPAEASAVADDLLTATYMQGLAVSLWPEPTHGCAVAVSSGRVSRAPFHAVRSVEFWTADPASDPTATLVSVLETTPDYVVLDTVLTSVHARFTLRPVFTSTAIVGGTTYTPGAVAYQSADGHVYCALVSALGSDYADATKWAPLPVLAALAEPVKNLALADWMQLSEPVYAQTLRTLAAQRLATPSTL